MYQPLRRDDRGMIISAEMMLGITLLLSATSTGMCHIRDAVVASITDEGIQDVEIDHHEDSLGRRIVLKNSD
jgi:hypothetical protein